MARVHRVYRRGSFSGHVDGRLAVPAEHSGDVSGRSAAVTINRWHLLALPGALLHAATQQPQHWPIRATMPLAASPVCLPTLDSRIFASDHTAVLDTPQQQRRGRIAWRPHQQAAN